VVAFGMELFRQAILRDVTIGPFEVQDLSVFQKVLPVVAAYLIYALWVTALETMRPSSFLYRLHVLHRPRLESSNFATVGFPLAPPLLQGIPRWLRTRGALGFVSTVFLRVFSLARLVVPWILVATWYVELFRRFGFHDLTTWVSLLLAASFLGYTVVILLLARRRGVL